MNPELSFDAIKLPYVPRVVLHWETFLFSDYAEFKYVGNKLHRIEQGFQFHTDFQPMEWETHKDVYVLKD